MIAQLLRALESQQMQEAGINRKLAPTIGITVDHRRTNKSVESLQLNVQRLKEYKERLVVFPRRNNKVKSGDATKAEIAASTLDTTSVNTLPKAADAVTFVPMSEVISFTLETQLHFYNLPEFSYFNTYRSSRASGLTTHSGPPAPTLALSASVPRSQRRAKRTPQQQQRKNKPTPFFF